jgi:DtxR family Mn-dependent transcriptional regulator
MPQVAPTTAIEDYVKAIYTLQERGAGAATTTALAERLGVTAGSVSAMLKKLDTGGLVSHEPTAGCASRRRAAGSRSR